MTGEERERSDAAWAAVLENMSMVRLYARPFRHARDADDIVQDGAIGFYLAASAFDRTLGYSLSTYCRHRVRKHILRSRASRDVVHVPGHARGLAAGVRRGRVDPSRLSPEDARTAALASAAMYGVTGDSTPEGARTLAAIPAGDDGPSDDREAVGRAVESLPERERDVIRMRFYDDMTLDEVSRAVGLTRQRISQIEKKALWRLRFRVAS